MTNISENLEGHVAVPPRTLTAECLLWLTIRRPVCLPKPLELERLRALVGLPINTLARRPGTEAERVVLDMVFLNTRALVLRPTGFRTLDIDLALLTRVLFRKLRLNPRPAVRLRDFLLDNPPDPLSLMRLRKSFGERLIRCSAFGLYLILFTFTEIILRWGRN